MPDQKQQLNLDDYNAFCRALPATDHVVQWRGSQVWKVGGKVFAIAKRDGDGNPTYTFKVSKIAFEALRHMPGLRPAPYLSPRSATWIQHYRPPGLSAADLKDHLGESHRLVSLGLSRKKRRELGLDE